LLRLAVFSLSVTAAFSLAACGGSGDDSTQSAGGDATTSANLKIPHKTIGIFEAAGNAEVVKRVGDAVNTSAEYLGWDTQTVDGQGDPAKMQQGMQSLVNSKVDAIVGVFMEPALVTQQLQAAKTAGIPVVNTGFVGSDSPLVAAQFVGDQTKMANLLLDQMQQDVTPDSKIGALNLQQYVGVQQRMAAFNTAADAAGWDVVATHDVNINDLLGDSTKAGQDILNAHPDLDAFFSCCDFGGQALAPAIQQSGKDVPVYTFYAIPSVLPLVREGKDTVVEEDNVKTAAMGIDALARYFTQNAPINAAFELNRDPIRDTVITQDNAPPEGQEVYPTDQLLAPYEQRWNQEYGAGS
jgi:ABC-type sugar transport system substrate-binding protein